MVSPTALVAIVLMLGFLTVPLLVFAAMAVRGEAHTPPPLRDGQEE